MTQVNPAFSRMALISAALLATSNGAQVLSGVGTAHAQVSAVSGSEVAQVSSSELQRIQRALNQFGYDAGPADGVMGPRTRSAISVFQHDNLLSDTGELDPDTVEALRAFAGIDSDAPVVDALEATLGRMTFDCSEAQTPTQRTVCADPLLRRLDFELAEAQRRSLALASGAEEEMARQSHRYYATSIGECGADSACIEERYLGTLGNVRAGLQRGASTPAPAHEAATRNERVPAPVVSGPHEIPEPLTAFRDCDVCPEMMALPSGAFWMGATEDDAALAFVDTSTELPRREVIFDYSFAIGRFNITVAEFATFVEETGHEPGGLCALRLPDTGPNAGRFIGTMSPLAPEGFRGTTELGPGGAVLVEHADFRLPGAEVSDDQPATCISRNEAIAYLEWLSAKSGRSYRLPTEAEWEYATRAGEERPFFWGGGQHELCTYGNFADSASVYSAAIVAPCAEVPSLEYTYPVGSFAPNNWGLYDMVGNVFEFVEDCYFPDYRSAPVDGSPWTYSDLHPDFLQDGKCQLWATRGYFFDSPYAGLRSASRCIGLMSWDERSNALGLRVAVSLSETAWDLNERE